MKKLNLKVIAITAAMTVAVVAVASQVYDRAADVTLARSTGAATWTNTVTYTPIKMVRINVKGCYLAIATVNVSRVTSDNAWTQTVGQVVCAANVGTTSSFTQSYLKPSDKLVFSTVESTGSVVQIEYEVQHP